MELLRTLARSLRPAEIGLATNVQLDVTGRVVCQLMDLARQFGTVEAGRITVRHNLSQGDLAQLVGARRGTVNRTLSKLERRGWVQVGYKSLVILDGAKLAHRYRTLRQGDAASAGRAGSGGREPGPLRRTGGGQSMMGSNSSVGGPAERSMRVSGRSASTRLT